MSVVHITDPKLFNRLRGIPMGFEGFPPYVGPPRASKMSGTYVEVVAEVGLWRREYLSDSLWQRQRETFNRWWHATLSSELVNYSGIQLQALMWWMFNIRGWLSFVQTGEFLRDTRLHHQPPGVSLETVHTLCQRWGVDRPREPIRTAVERILANGSMYDPAPMGAGYLDFNAQIVTAIYVLFQIYDEWSAREIDTFIEQEIIAPTIYQRLGIPTDALRCPGNTPASLYDIPALYYSTVQSLATTDSYRIGDHTPWDRYMDGIWKTSVKLVEEPPEQELEGLAHAFASCRGSLPRGAQEVIREREIPWVVTANREWDW